MQADLIPGKIASGRFEDSNTNRYHCAAHSRTSRPVTRCTRNASTPSARTRLHPHPAGFPARPRSTPVRVVLLFALLPHGFFPETAPALSTPSLMGRPVSRPGDRASVDPCRFPSNLHPLSCETTVLPSVGSGHLLAGPPDRRPARGPRRGSGISPRAGPSPSALAHAARLQRGSVAARSTAVRHQPHR